MLYVFFLPTFLQNSKKNSKIATKIAATVNEKNISKHDRMKKFSTGIQRKKKSCLQAFLLQSERVSEIHFLAIQRPKLQKFSFTVHPGDTSWRQ